VLHTVDALKVALDEHNLDETIHSYVTLNSFFKFVAN
jgi:hypothetical protein